KAGTREKPRPAGDRGTTAADWHLCCTAIYKGPRNRPETARMLTGQNAIITGSTSGIGLGIAEALAAKGANIVVNSYSDRTEDHAIAADLAARHGVEAVYIKADMARPDECRGLVEQAVSRFGTLDILVNNAGIQHVAPVEEFPTERWDAIIAINLSSAFHTTAAAVPHMRAAGYGRIVNIAS